MVLRAEPVRYQEAKFVFYYVVKPVGLNNSCFNWVELQTHYSPPLEFFRVLGNKVKLSSGHTLHGNEPRLSTWTVKGCGLLDTLQVYSSSQVQNRRTKN